MLRSSLCLLFSAMFVSAAFAQPVQTDVQSLQYEFGRSVAPAPPVCRCMPVQWIHWSMPVRCCVPVVRPVVPVVRPVCVPVVRPVCVPVARPVCVPVARPVCVPVARPVVHVPVVVRPAVCAPVVRPVLAPRWHRWHHPVFVHPGFAW